VSGLNDCSYCPYTYSTLALKSTLEDFYVNLYQVLPAFDKNSDADC
jgi:hypothetical protein